MSSWRSGRVSSWITSSNSPHGHQHAGDDTDQRRATPPSAQTAPPPSPFALHPRSLSTRADSARSRSSTVPSFSTTCSARAAFSSWVELARLALADQRVAARLGARAAHLVGGDDGDGGVEDAVHPGLEQQRHLDHGDLGLRGQRGQPGADPLPDQRVDLRLQPSQLLGVGEDDLADLGAVDAALGRDLRRPSARSAAPAAARSRAARGRPRRWRSSPRRGARKRRGPRTSRPRCRRSRPIVSGATRADQDCSESPVGRLVVGSSPAPRRRRRANPAAPRRIPPPDAPWPFSAPSAPGASARGLLGREPRRLLGGRLLLDGGGLGLGGGLLGERVCHAPEGVSAGTSAPHPEPSA